MCVFAHVEQGEQGSIYRLFLPRKERERESHALIACEPCKRPIHRAYPQPSRLTLCPHQPNEPNPTTQSFTIGPQMLSESWAQTSPPHTLPFTTYNKQRNTVAQNTLPSARKSRCRHEISTKLRQGWFLVAPRALMSFAVGTGSDEAA